MIVRIAIVEDDKETRSQVSKYLASISGFSIIKEFESAEDFIAEFRNLNIDVCLIDVGLPKMNGIDCIKKLKPLRPSVNFIVFSISDNSSKLFNALSAGATSYILKHQIYKLRHVIEDAAEGTGTFSPGIINKIREYFNTAQEGSELVQELTDREREVLKSASTGKSNKLIARELNVEEITIKKHISNIISKLHVVNRVEAIKIYLGQ